jgi:hypothetical protein
MIFWLVFTITKGVFVRQVFHWILNEFTGYNEQGLVKKQ